MNLKSSSRVFKLPVSILMCLEPKLNFLFFRLIRLKNLEFETKLCEADHSNDVF